ncbi:unnamed protein product [Symbiodinium natans]|uniref:Thioesterase domain-containing protein n=1 Tax=Symbiodinium natans TaxID=878477 RepID=A0A812JCG5_9DINO|nr:unnamed protein product [Symbiodinium natans]
MELVANYVDYSKSSSLAAVLRWCDTAGLYILKDVPEQNVKQKLRAMWWQSAVMRVIKAEIQVRGAAWETIFASTADSGTSVLANPTLTRLGNTSYTLQTQLSLASGGTPLARVETVMVQLDSDLQRPVPLPHNHLKPLLRPLPEITIPTVCDPPPSCFTWTVQVRPSDCDLLGHMNNASYAVLFEDARRAAIAGGSGAIEAVGSDDGLRMASIEYLAQARAFDVLRIAVWWDGQCHAYGLVMHTCSASVVARAVLVPFEVSRL